MTDLDKIQLIHEALVKCFWVVGVGAVVLLALNFYYWRKWK